MQFEASEFPMEAEGFAGRKWTGRRATVETIPSGALNSVLLERARGLLRARKRRAAFLPEFICGEPIWDMLLDLYIASLERKPIRVSSLCFGSGVPVTTAMRNLAVMERQGLVVRSRDPLDGRATRLVIAPKAGSAMRDYLIHGLR
jgi:hypothetical protein